MPFSDGFFDVVIAGEIVEHVPFPTHREFIAESARVLKKGGLLVITTPNGSGIMQVLFNAYGNGHPPIKRLLGLPPNDRHVNVLDFKQLEDDLKAQGFRIEEHFCLPYDRLATGAGGWLEKARQLTRFLPKAWGECQVVVAQK